MCAYSIISFSLSPPKLPYLVCGDFLITMAGVCLALQQGGGKDAEPQPKSLACSVTQPVLELSLAQDATARDLRPRTQPRPQVWRAPTQQRSSATQTLGSKHRHFNTVMNSRPQRGTRFGKAVRKVPRILTLGSQQSAHQLAKQISQKVTSGGTG